MRKLKIGYFGYSSDSTATGDRRRLAYWAAQRGHEIYQNKTTNVDVIVTTSGSNFVTSLSHSKIPKVFDLVDAYQVRENLLKDWTRGIGKILLGDIQGIPKPFTQIIREELHRADAVIVSSKEQVDALEIKRENIHIILDFHEELPPPFFPSKSNTRFRNSSIMWEGKPATLEGLLIFKGIWPTLYDSSGYNFLCITDLNYKKYFGKIGKKSTDKFFSRFPNSFLDNFKLIEWSADALIKAASEAKIGVLPINTRNAIQFLKPENRLLIMWRLGLPAITSNIPSYNRIAMSIDVNFTCDTQQEWVEKIDRLIKDYDFYHEYQEKSYDYIQRFHTKEIILRKWDHVFASVLS